jgi:arylsulfatase A-like enzyme
MDSFISRRSLLAGAVASASVAHAAPPASSKPNIVVILFDDLGVHDFGYLGAKDLKTPNIDSLAAGGVVCSNWYSNAPVCAPARSALMTGRHPLRAGVARNGTALRPSEITISAQLKQAGYRTGLTGKWHLGSTSDTVPNAHGFDYFYGFHEGCEDYYSHRYYWGEPARANFHDLWRNRDEIFEDGQYLTERIADEAVQFISQQPGQPFFLYTAFSAVHYPMHAPAKYVSRFPGLDRERQMYAAMLSCADDGVGRMLKALDQIGQRNNTLIVVLGDNGATTEKRAGLNQQPATAGRNGPFRGYKFSTFDGGMHVPGVVNWPGKLPAGSTNKELLMTADLFPTCCHLAGVALPTDRTLDGRNAWPVLTGGAPSQHKAIFWSEGPQLAVRKGDWKLVVNGVTHDGTPAGQKPLTGDDALFLSNLSQDPGESKNLRHQYASVLDDLQTSLDQWRNTVEQN